MPMRIAAFDTTTVCNEATAKQFARDLLTVIKGHATAANIPNDLWVVRPKDDPSFFHAARKGVDGWQIYARGDQRELAIEALKFARATPEPQANIIAALSDFATPADADTIPL